VWGRVERRIRKYDVQGEQDSLVGQCMESRICKCDMYVEQDSKVGMCTDSRIPSGDI
jgi:hypothetical protein